MTTAGDVMGALWLASRMVVEAYVAALWTDLRCELVRIVASGVYLGMKTISDEQQREFAEHMRRVGVVDTSTRRTDLS